MLLICEAMNIKVHFVVITSYCKETSEEIERKETANCNNSNGSYVRLESKDNTRLSVGNLFD